jgi:hypothetical protein
VEFHGRNFAQPNELPDSSGRKAMGKVATLKIDLARFAARLCPQSQ